MNPRPLPDTVLFADAYVDTDERVIVREPIAMSMVDGRISEVRTGPTVTCPDGAERLPSDVVLCPSFADPHVHLSFWPMVDHWSTIEASRSLGDVARRDLILANAASLLGGGVTAARDCGDIEYSVTAIDEWPPGLTVQTAGPAVTTAAGHLHWCSAESSSELSMHARVKRRQAAGALWVKLMASGGQMTPSSDPSSQQFTLEQVGDLVHHSRLHGLRTAAHALNTAAIRSSVLAAVDTIEHALWQGPSGDIDVDASVLRQMRRNGTSVVWTFAGLARHEVGLPGYEQLVVDPSVAAAGTRTSHYRDVRAVDAVLSAGVRVGLGSDAGVRGTGFDSFIEVIAAAVAITGLDAGEVLTMASLDNARILGLADRRLVPGAPADVVAVSIDAALNRFAVHAAWCRGQLVCDLAGSTAEESS